MESNRDRKDLEDGAIKDKSFLGIARVELSSLSFDHTLNVCHRETSPKAIKRLKQIFKTQGCRRYQDENFLNGIVSHEALDHALAEVGLTQTRLTRKEDGTIPLVPVLSVGCLHGLHRVRAAEHFLDEDDQWWVVRLYADGKLDHVKCAPLS